MSTERLLRNLVLVVLVVAAITAPFILLPADHPVLPFVVLAAVVLAYFLAKNGYCSLELTIPLFGWLALHVILRIAGIFVKAAWIDRLGPIIDLWLPGIFALLGAWAYAKNDKA